VNDFSIKSQQYRKVVMERCDWIKYNKENRCWLCNEEFDQSNIVKTTNGRNYKPKGKVIDHCHLSGDYIGAAHADCNF